MFTFNGKEFRNLEEQVLQNKRLIENVLEGAATLAEFGLKVVNITNDGTMPVDPPELEPGDNNTFGYAWLVQNNVGETPDAYDIYIWTRLNFSQGAGWVNLGEFPKPGPEGQQGANGGPGAQGPRGNRVYTTDFNNPATYATATPGDTHIDTITYTLRRLDATQWTVLGNIKGQQGEQGFQGPPGATPQIINGNWFIAGIDTGIRAEGVDGQMLNLRTGTYTTSSIPSFSITNPGDAFIVTDDPTYTTAIYFNGYGGATWTVINWAVAEGPPGRPGTDGKDGPPGKDAANILFSDTFFTTEIYTGNYDAAVLVGDLIIFNDNTVGAVTEILPNDRASISYRGDYGLVPHDFLGKLVIGQGAYGAVFNFRIRFKTREKIETVAALVANLYDTYGELDNFNPFKFTISGMAATGALGGGAYGAVDVTAQTITLYWYNFTTGALDETVIDYTDSNDPYLQAFELEDFYIGRELQPAQ